MKPHHYNELGQLLDDNAGCQLLFVSFQSLFHLAIFRKLVMQSVLPEENETGPVSNARHG